MFHEGGANSLLNTFVELSLGCFDILAEIVGSYVSEVGIVVDTVFQRFVNHLACAGLSLYHRNNFFN